MSAEVRQGFRARSSSVYVFVSVLFASSLLSAIATAQDVIINEIHYDPEDNTARTEFVELHNRSNAQVDLSGWFFSNGIRFVFPIGARIGPGQYLVVAQDVDDFRSAFGFTPDFGPYDGRLSSDGETVTLRSVEGVTEDRVDYGVGFPWPVASAGEGASMELIHPDLDNDLGSSWRASGFTAGAPIDPVYFLRSESRDWRYRKGTSEASNPSHLWRQPGFAEDGSWQTGRAGFGYGDNDDNTVLNDMRGRYTSVYLRHTFTIPDVDEIPGALRVRVYVDDGCIVYLNGVEVARFYVGIGVTSHDDTAQSHEASWEDIDVPNQGVLFGTGENLIAIHAFNQSIDSSDFSIDAEVLIPGSDGQSSGRPTPRTRNSIYSEDAAPQIRQVGHDPIEPPAGTPMRVSAKVTDPEGVESVALEYQIVEPGDYIPAYLPHSLSVLNSDPHRPHERNPEFDDPDNWRTVEMLDDGSGIDLTANDDVFTALVPGQTNRTLVRYRITVTDTEGNSAKAPFPDDPSLNFAAFVYDGVPSYRTTRRSIQPAGAGYTYPQSVMKSLPVYHIITRRQDAVTCIAASSSLQISQGREARFIENWEACVVYDREVYDHVRYRLRGANGRYQVPPGTPSGASGKRHWRFQFNKGNHFRARDRFDRPYPTRWRILNTGRMFGNRIDGNWGLGDQVNDEIYRAYGIPAPFGHSFHWRMIDGRDEAPGGADGQYQGDFWGIARAFENYDVRFLDAHGLPKGNLYKLVNQTTNGSDQQRYQAPDAVTNAQDHNNIEGQLRSSKSSQWLLDHVNYDAWYRYHSIAQAIRHYDYWPSANKNSTWYFEPDYRSGNSFLGRMWTLPFDTDATWGPTWNAGHDRPYDAIYSNGGKPDFQRDYRNHIREVRDLLWQRDQLEIVIRQVGSFMDQLDEADTDRWKDAPAAEGRQYFSSSAQRTVALKAADMIRFAFTGGSWPGGSVGGGGRARFLDSFADGPDANLMPRRPTCSYAGPPGFPTDRLTFTCSSFSDPQGAGNFGAVEWRIAEVAPIASPQSTSLSSPIWRAAPLPLEITPVWESGEISPFANFVQIPVGLAAPGREYRVRVRMKDSTGRVSHWSSPVSFTAGGPAGVVDVLDSLRITEIMYNPVGGADYEFVELLNIGDRPLDLSLVSFVDGIQFDFAGSEVEVLNPGEYVVIVRDLFVFGHRYDTSEIRIAGEYGGRLDNGRDQLRLQLGEGLAIHDFAYEDWFPDTDGQGRSLEIRDVRADPSTWGQSFQWNSSAELHGSPGRAPSGNPIDGGFRRVGDVNGDRRVDISDAVRIVRILFAGLAVELPCEGEDISSGGNAILHDTNGDEMVDMSDSLYLLNYLFGGGPEPIGGEECGRIVGCSDECEF